MQDASKLNGTHHLLFYDDYVNILGGSVYTIKENAEALVVDSKSIGLGGNGERTKYMVMSRDRNAREMNSTKTGNNSFEWVEAFRYLGTTLTDQKYIKKQLESRRKSGNACYHSVQNIFSSSLLSKNLEINVRKTIILPVVLYGCETWSLTLREERSLIVFKDRMLRRKFGPKREHSRA